MTREDIIAVYQQGPEAVVTLVTTLLERIAQLEARVKTLEDRLSQDSHNSHKPPSSDPFTRPPRSLRQPSGKKPGGQPGHPGHTLRLVEPPDTVVTHTPERCGRCAASLAHAQVVDTQRRQVWEVPPLRLLVTEHQALVKRCGVCGQTTRADFPDAVRAPVQYGPCLKALGVSLLDEQLLPLERTCQVLEDLFGQPLSEATLLAAQAQGQAALEAVLGQIGDGLTKAAVAHCDETGFYVNQQRQWLHVVSTAPLTYYAAHPKRGRQALQAIGIVPQLTGVAVHDAYASYWGYPCAHALCNVHHLRELTFLAEREQQEWAAQMKALLLDIKQSVAEAQAQGATCLPAAVRQGFGDRYQQILMAGREQQPARPAEASEPSRRGRRKQSKAQNLLDRFQRYRAEVLRFMDDFKVPFDNNQAERDVRMMKVQQKVSGCFRSVAGADAFCRIRSYLSTARKQGVNALHALQQLFMGHPFMPVVDT